MLKWLKQNVQAVMLKQAKLANITNKHKPRQHVLTFQLHDIVLLYNCVILLDCQ